MEYALCQVNQDGSTSIPLHNSHSLPRQLKQGTYLTDFQIVPAAIWRSLSCQMFPHQTRSTLSNTKAKSHQHCLPFLHTQITQWPQWPTAFIDQLSVSFYYQASLSGPPTQSSKTSRYFLKRHRFTFCHIHIHAHIII